MARRSLFQSEPRRASPRWLQLPSLPTVLLLVVWTALVMIWAQLYGWNVVTTVRQTSTEIQAAVTLPQVRLPPPDKAVVEARAPTLVVYVFSGSDPEYAGNLRFFVREAVRSGDGCQYLIVLQEGEGLELPDPLPDLPSNARYLRHENACYDIGTVGWVLEKHINVQFFKYYVWLNSSVRGPFLPAYLRGRLHWTEPLLSRLSPAVKLVGATINCGRAYELPPTPHVQSYVAATDAAGLEVLLATGRVFKCWESMRETVINSEIGASVAIMGAGYTIDSLMLRYQGVDWGNPELRSRDCNGAFNPLQPDFNDGISVDPLEVMFIKVKSSMRAAGNWPHVTAAVKLDQWLTAQAAGNESLLMESAAANEWPARVAPALLADARRRGPPCFDTDFYIRSSMYDLGFMLQEADGAQRAWEQFLQMGLYEGRPYRFTC